MDRDGLFDLVYRGEVATLPAAHMYDIWANNPRDAYGLEVQTTLDPRWGRIEDFWVVLDGFALVTEHGYAGLLREEPVNVRRF